jgi:hypothetical protein
VVDPLAECAGIDRASHCLLISIMRTTSRASRT